MLLNRERADAIMDREGLAAIVASSPINTYYLSSWATDASWGFGDLALCVLPRDRAMPAAVITVEVDAGQPQQRDGTWMDIVRGYARRPGIGPGGVQASADMSGLPADHATAIAAWMTELGVREGTVGFEDRGLGADVATLLPGLRVADAKDLLREIRMVKTPQELAFMRAAARKTDVAIAQCAEAIAAGATCAEAERVFWACVPMTGARPMFLLITPFRPGQGRLPKTAQLQPGDMVTFDATAEFAHYTSDIGRTLVIGEPSADQLRCYNATRQGWLASLDAFRDGAFSPDVEATVAAAIRAAGNPEYKSANIHSVGLEHTDHPHPGNATAPFTLETGMVLSCDLPWIGPAVGKFHFEDIILLGTDGVEILNRADNRLIACIDGRTEYVG